METKEKGPAKCFRCGQLLHWDPTSESYESSGVATVSFGYGSQWDCMKMVLHLCDHCVAVALLAGNVAEVSHEVAVPAIEYTPVGDMDGILKTARTMLNG